MSDRWQELEWRRRNGLLFADEATVAQTRRIQRKWGDALTVAAEIFSTKVAAPKREDVQATVSAEA